MRRAIRAAVAAVAVSVGIAVLAPAASAATAAPDGSGSPQVIDGEYRLYDAYALLSDCEAMVSVAIQVGYPAYCDDPRWFAVDSGWVWLYPFMIDD